MNKEKLANGKYLLTAPNGVVDLRNGRVYSEVIQEESMIHFFEAYQPTEEK